MNYIYIITSISESKHLHCMCGCVRERAGRSEGGFLHRRKLHSARHSPRNKTSWGIKATSHSNIGTSVTSVNDCWFSYDAIKQAIEHRSRQCCRCDHVKPNGADPCTKNALHTLPRTPTMPPLLRVEQRPGEKEPVSHTPIGEVLSPLTLSRSTSHRVVWPWFKILHITHCDSTNFSFWKGHTDSSWLQQLGSLCKGLLLLSWLDKGEVINVTCGKDHRLTFYQKEIERSALFMTRCFGYEP